MEQLKTENSKYAEEMQNNAAELQALQKNLFGDFFFRIVFLLMCDVLLDSNVTRAVWNSLQ